MPRDTDLVIVHPGAAHGIYGALGDDLTALEPPQWARIIGGYCRDRGYSVRIIDAEAEALGPQDVAAALVKARPRLVCLAVYGHQPSASTQQMTAAGAIARAYKRLPDAFAPIIMVGGHISALPQRTMEEELVDYACVGEGPITIDHLLAGVEDRLVPGLVWRGGNSTGFGIHVNPPAHLVDGKDLEEYESGTAWAMLPMHRYRAHNWQCFGDLKARRPYASIWTSLGCPYRCSFCCINAPFQSNRYRMRAPANVVAEIVDLYRNYGVRTLKITDEMFVLNEKHYTAICQGILDAGLGGELNIWAYARVDTVEAGHLALMRAAGIRWLALGIESGSAHVRDGARKKLGQSDIVDTVRAIQAAGINVIGNYIFGLPDDDMASMQDTLKLAMELNTEFANMYCAHAYPGSPLYDQAVKTGAMLPKTNAGYSQHNKWCRPLDTKHLDGAAVLKFRDAAFTAYFSNPRYLAMIDRKFGPETLGHIEKMLTYKLDRLLLDPEHPRAELESAG